MAQQRSGEQGGREASHGPWTLLDSAAFAAEQLRAEKGGQRGIAARLAMERAAVVLSGEVGYEEMTVASLLERSGSNRSRFYASFAGKAQCYAAGYTAAIDQLAERLLQAGAGAESWPAGMAAALEELSSFVSAEPALARGLIAEVRVAGGAAMAKRKEVFKRLSRAIDTARRETTGSRHSPPPIAPDFILSGIEAAVLKSFRDPEAGFDAMLGGLIYLAVIVYFGSDVARAQMQALKEAQRRSR